MSGRGFMLHLDIPVVVLAGAGLIALSWHADVTSAAGDTFTAAITVLVFLLPSTSLLGGYLANAIDATSGLLDRAKTDDVRSRREDAARTQIGRLLEVAAPLRRAIVYTTAAVVLSGAALFEPGGRWREVTVTEALIAISVAMLVGTAFTVLPATWKVLDYRLARDYLDKELPILAAPRTQANADIPAKPVLDATVPEAPKSPEAS